MTDEQKQRLRRDVAEKVMGWVISYPNPDDKDSWIWLDSKGFVVPDLMWYHETGMNTPPFESEIAWAWQVLDYVTSPQSGLFNPKTTFPAGTHIAYTWDNANLWACNAQEAAEKICLMCYEAVTGQEWE